jgi:hypothetical protein
MRCRNHHCGPDIQYLYLIMFTYQAEPFLTHRVNRDRGRSWSRFETRRRCFSCIDFDERILFRPGGTRSALFFWVFPCSACSLLACSTCPTVKNGMTAKTRHALQLSRMYVQGSKTWAMKTSGDTTVIGLVGGIGKDATKGRASVVVVWVVS